MMSNYSAQLGILLSAMCSSSCEAPPTRLNKLIENTAPGFRELISNQGWLGSYAMAGSEELGRLEQLGPREISSDEFYAVLSRATTVLLSDVHGYRPVFYANVEIARKLIEDRASEYGALEFVYQEWEDQNIQTLGDNIVRLWPSFAANHGLDWCVDLVALCRAHEMPVLGLNNAVLDDRLIRIDLSRMQASEMAAEQLRKRDRWAAQRVASQSRSGFVVYGRLHCLQREFAMAMPGCVTVFANDFEILSFGSVETILRDRGADEAVFLQFETGVLAAYIPGWHCDH